MEDISKVVKREDLDVVWVRWKCLDCSYLYEGVQTVRKCPKCGNENPNKFSDID